MAEPEQTQQKSRIPGTLDQDRPLPSNHEAEAAVLGAILSEPKPCLDQAMEILGNAASFFDESKRGRRQSEAAQAVFHNFRNQRVYSCLCELHAQGNSIDLISLSHALKAKKWLDDVGGQEYLVQLMESIATTVNIESWCKLVRDCAIVRNLIVTCDLIKEDCHKPNADASNLLGEVQRKIMDIGSMEDRAETVELKSLIDHKKENSAFNYLLRLSKKDESTTGVPTKYADLDRLIMGLKPGEMFVLAARPSIGKTSFALNLVRNITMDSKRRPVGFFSLEMTAEQLSRRLLCTESGYSEQDFYEGQIMNNSLSKITAAAHRLCEAKVYIDPTPALKIRELRSKAQRMSSLYGIQVIFVDYLQLMRAETRSDNRQEEVAAISSGIKALAKELNLPIVVLAQLNREVEKSQGRPKLSHLRESGAIEQDADIVAFLHRERDMRKDNSIEAQTKGVAAELIIEKNRNGRTGTVDLLFFPRLMCFESRSRFDDVEAVG